MYDYIATGSNHAVRQLEASRKTARDAIEKGYYSRKDIDKALNSHSIITQDCQTALSQTDFQKINNLELELNRLREISL